MFSSLKKNPCQIIKQIENALEKNETELATTSAIFFYNTLNGYDLQKITLENKPVCRFLWSANPWVAACLLETWVNSSEKKEDWRQAARLIFKAMPKEYPDKEEYSEFLPGIIDLCHKENICGDNKTINQPNKRKYELFHKEENKKMKTQDERVLQSLSIKN